MPTRSLLDEDWVGVGVGRWRVGGPAQFYWGEKRAGSKASSHKPSGPQLQWGPNGEKLPKIRPLPPPPAGPIPHPVPSWPLRFNV